MKIEGDWYPGEIPASVELGDDVYIDSAYGFAACEAGEAGAVSLGRATGAYDRSAFIVGPRGRVAVGEFSCLNACYLICHSRITIGSYCMFAWGVVVSDVWPATGSSIAERRAAIRAASTGCRFRVPAAQPPRPILIDDNVWVGFNSVIMPGVTIGRGAVIGANTVVSRDVEPYTVVVGNPPVVVRRLPATDSPEALRSARDALKD